MTTRKRHRWDYQPEWMDTPAGKHVGGFSRCRDCGVMRFQRPGHPPQSYYVARRVLDENRDNTRIRPGHPDVMALAPECVVATVYNGLMTRQEVARAVLEMGLFDDDPPTPPAKGAAKVA